VPLDKQGIIRPNRETLYSAAVFDLDAGPVTIMRPGQLAADSYDAGQRTTVVTRFSLTEIMP
jgi:hypothetical protein